jgi:hypothetical protein
MNIKRSTRLTAAVSGLGLLGLVWGCQPAQQAPTQTEVKQAPENDVVEGATRRVNDMAAPIESLRQTSMQLPGKSESEQRTLMEDCFGNIAAILPLLEGPNPTGGFRQQVMLVEGAKANLQSLGPELSSDPTIASGLRAAYNALGSISAEEFTDQPDIFKTIASLGAKLDQLDTTQGPMAPQVEEEATRLIADTMEQMHAVLKQRLGVPVVKAKPAAVTPPTVVGPPMAKPPAATKPAVKPSTMPTTTGSAMIWDAR